MHPHLSDRNELEQTVRAWDQLERYRGGPPVIDFDLGASATRSRFQRPEEVADVLERLQCSDNHRVRNAAEAHLTYLRALMHHSQESISDYLRGTQGVGASFWPNQYLETRRAELHERLSKRGIDWGPRLLEALANKEGGALEQRNVTRLLRDEATKLTPRLTSLVGSTPDTRYTIEFAHADAYWSYWVDGNPRGARLRVNESRARYTGALLRQFAMHEVLGHIFQLASWASTAAEEEVLWPRYTSVHGRQQILLEGLAQALPLFLAPEDEEVVTRVWLDHRQLVLGQMHVTAHLWEADHDQLSRHVQQQLPWLNEEEAHRAVTDRSRDPLLRTYLWSYPIGFDFFVRVWEKSGPDTVSQIVRMAYRQPIDAGDLADQLSAGSIPIEPHLVLDTGGGK